MSTELEMFEKWLEDNFEKPTLEHELETKEQVLWAWLSRAELAKQDNQVIAELAEALKHYTYEENVAGIINQAGHKVVIEQDRTGTWGEFGETATKALTKHAERIKQAQETREGE